MKYGRDMGMGKRGARLAWVIGAIGWLAACGGGEESQPASPAPTSPSPVDSGVTIGREGGTLTVTDRASALYGARLIIPAGALSADQVISLEAATDPTLPATYTIAGQAIECQPAGLEFQTPVTIVLPYADSDNDGYLDNSGEPETEVGAMYVDPVSGRLELFTVEAQDTEANLVTIRTSHFSTYLIYVGSTTPPVTGDGGTEAEIFLPGEHFYANPSFTYDVQGNEAVLIPQDAPYFFLSILNWENGPVGHIDIWPCSVENSTICEMNADYTACTFDAAELFPKVARSGDAALWDWQSGYVAEWTQLQNYRVRDDTLSNDDSAQRIYCSIDPVDTTRVTITWGVNALEEVYSYTTLTGLGDRLIVRFWATYHE